MSGPRAPASTVRLARTLGRMPIASVPPPHAELRFLSKQDLRLLADGLLAPDPWIVDRCIEFVIAETSGLWHGRARAMMCRRLKHCEFGRTNRDRLVGCILGRLRTGSFSEQFKDQLRLALLLERSKTLETCEQALSSRKPHVRRYGALAIALDRAHEENAA